MFLKPISSTGINKRVNKKLDVYTFNKKIKILQIISKFIIYNICDVTIPSRKIVYSFELYLFVMIIFVIPLNSIAQKNYKKDLFWTEIWSNTSYRKTNFGVEADSYKEEDFFITIISCNAGLRFPIAKWLFFDPYFNIDMSEDFGNKTWNKVFWNNNMKFGPGLRLRYEYENKKEKKNLFRLNNSFVGVFSEYLFMFESLDGSNDSIPDSVHSENLKVGIDSWIFIESKEYNAWSIWGEAWSEFSYNSRNFYHKNTNDFYNLSMQPRIGIQYTHEKFSVQPYYKLHLSADLGDKSWNKEPWFNNIQYGPGIRLLFENFKIKEDLTLLIYAETLRIDYLSRVDKSKCNNIASKDCRINFELWIPFGSISKSIFAH